ncbi:protein VACUOLELESS GAMETOPHYTES [Ziziphus jujuba]|uniref:Protein VACUOLELESS GAMETOPHYTES n=1 Tax=Ziziphus jujuba TaxID=326968 RepID=A0ABM3ZYE1_ZIZJJ|nr:protein VACUOLELESS GAMETOPHYTES [Ziziphus jujuba]
MSKFEIWHPGHEHALVRYRYEELSFVFQTCHGRRHELPRTDANFIWQEMECEYYLDVECARLKDEDMTIHHPLHPQHFLILNFNDERNQFVCNFYGETKESSFFYDYGHDQCDFYLDVYCSICLASNEDLHEKYEIQHFLHDQNHRLSPFIHENEPCGGCGRNTSERLIFHCNSCSFYLYVPCSQIPEEEQHNIFHPEHSLKFLPSPPTDLEYEPCLACR